MGVLTFLTIALIILAGLYEIKTKDTSGEKSLFLLADGSALFLVIILNNCMKV